MAINYLPIATDNSGILMDDAQFERNTCERL